jgi:CPA2 family monovalent cation:H+ antiporter-2
MVGTVVPPDGGVVRLAVLARVAARLRFSPIPLYLLAGLAFGRGGAIPLVTADEFIEAGAEIGLILMLFSLGLEYSARELVDSLRSTTWAGAMDAALNFTPGFLAGLVLGWDVVAAVFLGGVTYISSSGVIARTLDDLGWMGNRETPLVLAVLVIEDLVMAGFLPPTTVLLVGGGAEQVAFDRDRVVVVAGVGLIAAGTVAISRRSSVDQRSAAVGILGAALSWGRLRR